MDGGGRNNNLWEYAFMFPQLIVPVATIDASVFIFLT